jgi:hypothetical protein
VRLIDSSSIGRDVSLPALTIHYRVESRVQAQDLEGRDRTYVLPAQSVRIMSNVPTDATDIRDGSEAPFGAIEATRFRARVFDIASIALGALGVILLIPAAIRAMGLTKARAKGQPATVSDRAVLGRALGQLSAVQTEGSGGWTPDLLSRALASARVVAGYAVGRRASQHALGPGTDPVDARFTVTSGLFRKRRASVASPTTTDDLARAIELLPATSETERRARLEQLRDALAKLTRAQYANAPAADAQIDDAVRSILGAGAEVKREHAWWREAFSGARRRA